MAERLQKLISAAGLMSRRAAENAIRQGRVTVNGRTAVLGDCAGPDDCVQLDGMLVEKSKQMYYLAVNKPCGYVTTMKDEKGRKTVCDLVREVPARVYPVGRLDLNSEGLLIMTNDGEFAELLAHPAGGFRKTYLVTVTGNDLEDSVQRLKLPFTVDGSEVQATDVIMLRKDNKEAVLSVTIREGKNRQIRKMCEMASLTVKRLKRIQEGPVLLGDLPIGCYRHLTEEEVNFVYGR